MIGGIKKVGLEMENSPGCLMRNAWQIFNIKNGEIEKEESFSHADQWKMDVTRGVAHRKAIKNVGTSIYSEICIEAQGVDNRALSANAKMRTLSTT